MTRILLGLLLLLSSTCAQARSAVYAVKRLDTTALRQNKVNPIPAGFAGNAAGGEHQHISMGSKRHEANSFARMPYKKKAVLKYDITRETGGYFFDTVYKLKVPATKHLSVGLNGGYTYFDRYAHGFGRAGSIGLVGGLSLTMPCKAGTIGRPKKGFMRLNADVISYPYRRMPGDGPKTSLLDRYTRELSTRMYVDARISWRNKGGSFTTRCMLGLVATGQEPLTTATPFFAGLSVAYRFL